MADLFHKDEPISSAPAVIGMSIMRALERRQLTSISLFDLIDEFRDEKWFSPKKFYFGLIFLFTTGVIQFNEPFIEIHVQAQ